MAGGGGEKTEQATAKRRRDERKKGNVFKSQEIITLASLVAVIYTIQGLGNLIMGSLTRGFDTFFNMAATKEQLVAADLPSLFVRGVISWGIAALPALLVAGLVAIIATMAQTRGLFAAEGMKPKFSRMSPMQGFKKIFSMRGIMELLKSLVKIIILAYVIYNQYSSRFEELPRLMEMEFGQAFFFGVDFLMDIVTSVVMIYAFLAAADYMYQRWQYEKDLRMTKQEVKEEYKQTEGDPQIKGKIKQKQRQMAMSRMMANVPESDVIIRNPTHYAVAIRYEAGKNRAPMVLAKGTDLTALRIVRIGAEHGVLAVENRQLARRLYETVPLDREIPEEFFQPVAEILAYVYSKSKKHKLPKMAPSERRQPAGS